MSWPLAGVHDIKAYMAPALWTQLLEKHNITETYMESRYDLILHLVTAADGAEKFFTCENNTARTETPEQARVLDKMIEDAYEKHKTKGIFARIDNSTEFKGKLERATAAVMAMLEGDTLVPFSNSGCNSGYKGRF